MEVYEYILICTVLDMRQFWGDYYLDDYGSLPILVICFQNLCGSPVALYVNC